MAVAIQLYGSAPTDHYSLVSLLSTTVCVDNHNVAAGSSGTITAIATVAMNSTITLSKYVLAYLLQNNPMAVVTTGGDDDDDDAGLLAIVVTMMMMR